MSHDFALKRNASTKIMHLLRVALRALPRPSHLRVPFVLQRHFESEAPVSGDCGFQSTGNAPPFAKTFLDTIESINNSHRATQKDLTAAHERQVLAMQQELKSAQRELRIELLKMDLHKIQNKLNLRSAIEIVAYTLDERCKSLNLVNPATGSGVQKIIDAAVRGGYDDGGVTFEKSKATVIKAVTTRGGIKPVEVREALRTLYDLSKDFHPGLSETLEVHHGKQTVPEAIAAMSIIHFAQCAYGSNLDAVYYNSNKKPQFTISAL
ncbi:hypothetical protein GGX14DRAFT_564020 [Mycena pura]|uniref:Uncharacterized protein n=1 Tax=Mycena pura TaxID=153505 RepID=A0AAD6VKT2_9AGAR|nr:hypothetical protein GGX14DRAFT_564020 [Mycena pura]